MIDREKIIRELEDLGGWHTHHYNPLHYEYAETIHNALVLLKEQPEVVRCKDCKYYESYGKFCRYDGAYKSNSKHLYGIMCNPDWYCADGERKEE